MKKKTIYLALLGLMLSGATYAQDTHTASHTVTISIPTVAILDIEGTNQSLTLAFAAPTEAGLGITSAIDNSLWLNYSYIGAVSGNTAAISAKVNQEIAKFDIRVAAGAATGTEGGGTKGTPIAQGVKLITTDTQLLTGIGSSYTGNGTNNGHQLTYTATLNDASAYKDLFKETKTPITVTYTIASN